MKNLLILLLFITSPLPAQIIKSGGKAHKTTTQNSLTVDWLKTYSSTAGDNDYFKLKSNTGWLITDYPDWVTISNMSGYGNLNVTVTVLANSGAQRIDSLGIVGTRTKKVWIKVAQSAGSAPTPYLRTGNLSQFSSANGSSDTVHIKSNGPWSVTDLSFTNSSPKSGTGNGIVTVTVTGNTGAFRSGNIVVSGTGVTSQNVAVSQADGIPAQTIDIDYLDPFAPTASQTDWFNVFTETNTPWHITKVPVWVTPSKNSGIGSAIDATGVHVSIAANNTGSTRTGYIVVKNLNNTVADSLLVTQYGSSFTASLTFTQIGTLSNANGASGTFDITSNVSFAISYPSWCSGTTTGSGNSTITVTATQNTGSQRTGTVTITGTGMSAQTMTVTQGSGQNSSVADYYVAPNGSDSNAGTISSPFYSLNKVISVIQPGQTAYFRGGTYSYTTQQNIMDITGSEGNLIKIWAYPGEKPIFQRAGSAANGISMKNAHYIHIKGITMRNYNGSNLSSGIYAHWGGGVGNGSDNNIFEACDFYNNGLGALFDGSNQQWINCDFHENYGQSGAASYGDADGIEIYPSYNGSTSGTSTLTACRSWHNGDDGFDCSDNDENVIFLNCWSYKNGFRADHTTKAGDGNGFKLGWSNTTTTSFIRTVTNCVSSYNYAHGFTDNTIRGKIKIYNCTAHGNGNLNSSIYSGFGIDFTIGGINNAHDIKNNLFYSNKYNGSANGLNSDRANVLSNAVLSTNSWNIRTANSSDFVSLDSSQLRSSRQSDGSLPVINYLHLTSGSAFKNAASDQGYGTDIGAFSSTSTGETTYTQPFTSLGNSIQNKKLSTDASISTAPLKFTNTGFDIQNCQIDGNYTNTYDLLTAEGATSAKTCKFKYNVVTFKNTGPHVIAVGSEGSSGSNNHYDGVEFIGNKLTGIGNLSSGMSHGFYVGFSKNNIYKYNFFDNAVEPIVFEGTDYDNSSGIISYNVFKNSQKESVTIASQRNTRIYNNTFYCDETLALSYPAFITSEAGYNSGTQNSNTVIKNNIFYSTGTRPYMLQFADYKASQGLDCDYNVYYRVGGNPLFIYTNSSGTVQYLTFAQWQALGYDTHSVVVDPYLNSTTLIPTSTVNHATALTGNESGIDPANVWNRSTTVTKSQGGVWQNGAFIK